MTRATHLAWTNGRVQKGIASGIKETLSVPILDAKALDSGKERRQSDGLQARLIRNLKVNAKRGELRLALSRSAFKFLRFIPTKEENIPSFDAPFSLNSCAGPHRRPACRGRCRCRADRAQGQLGSRDRRNAPGLRRGERPDGDAYPLVARAGVRQLSRDRRRSGVARRHA